MPQPSPGALRAKPTPRLARALALGLPVLLLAPVLRGVILVVLLWDLMLILLWLLEARRLKRALAFKVERDPPHRFSVGVWNEVKLRVESLAPEPIALRLLDRSPPEFDLEPGPEQLRVEAWRAAVTSYRLRPLKRGSYRFGDCGFEAEGRLGLAAVTGSIPLASDARVYPDLVSLRRAVLGARARDLASAGLRRLRQEGSGDEFDKLRDYLPDDDFRAISWKATAKRSKPVTQVHVAERSQRVLLAIDCGRSMAAKVGDLTRLDLAINAALLLAHVALRGGDRVGLTVFSSELKALVPHGRGRAHFARLVETLQGVPETLVFVDYRALARELVSRRVPRGLVVLFTDVLDESSARPLVEAFRLLARKHATLVLTPSDPVLLAATHAEASSAEEVYRSLAARESLAEREGVIERLRGLGVDVLDVSASELAVAGVNRYLELKRRRAI